MGVLPTLLSAQPAEAKSSPARLGLVERVAEHVARGAEGSAVASVLVRLPAAPQPVAIAALAGLVRGWPKGRPAALGPDADAALVKLVDMLPANVQGQVVTLAQHTGSTALDSRIDRISDALVETIDDADAQDADRISAAERLVLLRPADPKIVDLVIQRVGGKASPEMSAGLITALGRSSTAEAPAVILDRLASFTPPVREAAVRTILANRDWAATLVGRLEKRQVNLGDIPITERTKLTDHPDRKVRDRAKKILAAGGGLPNADRQKVIDEILPVVLRGGDASRGKLVFKEQCGTCHMHSGEGGRVGPELTGMAVHPAHELLIHILDPNRSVEGNYRAYTVTTDEGRVVTGLLAAESKTAIELVDAEGKRSVIQRSEIDEFQPSPNSLMPVGFEKQIRPEGFADLLAFLTKRGKFVPLSLEKVATAVSTKGMFHDQHAVVERLVFPDWGPKTFQGVPFTLVDPQGDRVPNVVLLHGPQGLLPPKMPKSVSLSMGAPIQVLHILGGVAGWGFAGGGGGSTSMLVRFTYQDGTVEDHPLVNGEHMADYIRRVDVPKSEFAFDLDGRQLRYLKVVPQRPDPIMSIDLVKGSDATAPVVMAITVETR
jgi:putative heme-binding domain-containing protein